MISIYTHGLFDELSKIATSNNAIRQMKAIAARGSPSTASPLETARRYAGFNYVKGKTKARQWGQEARYWHAGKEPYVRKSGVDFSISGARNSARAQGAMGDAIAESNHKLRTAGPTIPGPKPPEPDMSYMQRLKAGMHNEKLKQTKSKVMASGGYAHDTKRSADSPKNLYRKLPKEE